MADTTSTQNTASTQAAPLWATQYMQDMLGRAQALSDTPYVSYPGQRTAEFTPLQQQAFQLVGNMQRPEQFNTATQMLTQAGNSVANQPRWIDPGIAGAYMSPYQQQVTDVAKRKMMEDAERARITMGGRAMQAGAYGGSRYGILEGMHANDTLQRASDLDVQGLQSAYTAGMGQFNADRNAQTQGLSAMTQAGIGLGQIGSAQFNTDTGIANAMGAAGAQQQGLTQKGYDTDYANFMAQRQYPYEQINFLNNTLRGYNTPTSTNSTSTTTQPAPSMWSQLAGAGTALYGVGSAFDWWKK